MKIKLGNYSGWNSHQLSTDGKHSEVLQKVRIFWLTLIRHFSKLAATRTQILHPELMEAFRKKGINQVDEKNVDKCIDIMSSLTPKKYSVEEAMAWEGEEIFSDILYCSDCGYERDRRFDDREYPIRCIKCDGELDDKR